MIRINNSPEQFQIKHGVTMVRNGQEELGVRYLKAEPLQPVGKAYIEVKTSYVDVHSDYYGMIGKVVENQDTLIKVAYKDYYNSLQRAIIDNLVQKKTIGDVGSYARDYPRYDYEKDDGPSDLRYHLFLASEMELLIENIDKKDNTIVLFKDVHSGREFVFKSDVIIRR